MCDVHLDEIARVPHAHIAERCSSCDAPINGPGICVAGTLDDGSPSGIQLLYYHADCLDGIEYDGQDDHDGCFWYGPARRVVAGSKELMAIGATP